GDRSLEHREARPGDLRVPPGRAPDRRGRRLHLPAARDRAPPARPAGGGIPSPRPALLFESHLGPDLLLARAVRRALDPVSAGRPFSLGAAAVRSAVGGTPALMG